MLWSVVADLTIMFEVRLYIYTAARQCQGCTLMCYVFYMICVIITLIDMLIRIQICSQEPGLLDLES